MRTIWNDDGTNGPVLICLPLKREMNDADNEMSRLRASNSNLLEACTKAEMRIAQLCETVNTLAGFRKVRLDDFSEEVRAAIAKAAT